MSQTDEYLQQLASFADVANEIGPGGLSTQLVASSAARRHRGPEAVAAASRGPAQTADSECSDRVHLIRQYWDAYFDQLTRDNSIGGSADAACVDASQLVPPPRVKRRQAKQRDLKPVPQSAGDDDVVDSDDDSDSDINECRIGVDLNVREWLLGFHDTVPPLFPDLISLKPHDRVLLVGAGTSTFGVELFEWYRHKGIPLHVVNSDISPVAGASMAPRFPSYFAANERSRCDRLPSCYGSLHAAAACTTPQQHQQQQHSTPCSVSASSSPCEGCVRWVVDDATALQCSDGSFQLIIDKCTSDTLLVRSPKRETVGYRLVRQLFAESYRALVPGGVFLLLTPRRKPRCLWGPTQRKRHGVIVPRSAPDQSSSRRSYGLKAASGGVADSSTSSVVPGVVSSVGVAVQSSTIASSNGAADGSVAVSPQQSSLCLAARSNGCSCCGSPKADHPPGTAPRHAADERSRWDTIHAAAVRAACSIGLDSVNGDSTGAASANTAVGASAKVDFAPNFHSVNPSIPCAPVVDLEDHAVQQSTLLVAAAGSGVPITASAGATGATPAPRGRMQLRMKDSLISPESHYLFSRIEQLPITPSARHDQSVSVSPVTPAAVDDASAAAASRLLSSGRRAKRTPHAFVCMK